MNVRRATLIPPGIDGGKRDFPVAVGGLNTAQERLRSLGAVLGVIAGCVHVPDLDVGIEDGCATVGGIHHRIVSVSTVPLLPSLMSLRNRSTSDG